MDSRSVPELFFDQGLADFFTLRVAGNVLNDDIRDLQINRLPGLR